VWRINHGTRASQITHKPPQGDNKKKQIHTKKFNREGFIFPDQWVKPRTVINVYDRRGENGYEYKNFFICFPCILFYIEDDLFHSKQ